MRAVLLIQAFVRRWKAKRALRRRTSAAAPATALAAKPKPRTSKMTLHSQPPQPVQNAATSIQRWWRGRAGDAEDPHGVQQHYPHHCPGYVPDQSLRSEDFEQAAWDDHGAGSGRLAQLEAAQMLEHRMAQVIEEEARRRGGGAGPLGGFAGSTKQPGARAQKARSAQEVANMLGLSRSRPALEQSRHQGGARVPSRGTLALPGGIDHINPHGGDVPVVSHRSGNTFRMSIGTPSTKASATDSDRMALKLQAIGEKLRTEAVERLRLEWAPTR